MTQNIIVALIVGLAALYAVWRWMPAAWRRAAAGHVASGSRRAGLVDEERAQQLAASLAKTSGCGSCESCGSCSMGDKARADGTRTGTAGETMVAPPAPRSR